MQVIAVRCPRCLLTVYTTIINDAPGTNSPTIFMVASLADEDLLYYNCPMNVCGYHVTSSNPTNLYRNSAFGRPMSPTPGIQITQRTSDTTPFRTAEEVAALKIDVDISAAAVNEGVGIPTTPTTTAAVAENEPATRPPAMAWRANTVPRPRPTTERPTPGRPTAKRLAIERPATEQTTTTTARFVVAPHTPQRSNNGYQARRNGAGVPPVADIPRPTLAPPSTEKPAGIEKPTSIEKPSTAKPSTAKPIAEKATAEQPRIKTPAAEKPAIKKPTPEQPNTETPARERASPQGNGHEAAKQNGTSSPAAGETQQQQQQLQTTGLITPGTKWTDAEVDKLRELNRRGIRQAAIATEMNRALASVKYKLGEVRKMDRQARAAAAGQEADADGQT